MSGYLEGLPNKFIVSAQKLLTAKCNNTNDCDKLSFALQDMQYICDDTIGIKKGTKRGKDTLCGLLEKRKKYIASLHTIYSDRDNLRSQSHERTPSSSHKRTPSSYRSQSHKRTPSSRSRGGKRRNRTSKRKHKNT